MKTPFYVIIMLFLFNMTMIVFLYPVEWYKKSIEYETNGIRHSMDNPEQVVSAINQGFTAKIIDSGLLRDITQYFVGIPSPEEGQVIRPVYDLYILNRIEAFQYAAYQLVLRTTITLKWLPYILVFVVPLLYDAYNLWRIRQTNFEYPSPFFSYFSAGTAILMTVLIALIITLPIPLPHSFYPIYLFILMVLVSFAIAHSQKRI